MEVEAWGAESAISPNTLQLLLNSDLKPAIELRARIMALPVGLAPVPPDTLQYSFVISITYDDENLA
jgi:hypothetical protein